jgi:hypothetical protein
MFINSQSKPPWYKYTTRLDVLYVSSIVAIIKYMKFIQSPFLLSATPPYIGQCLHNGSALYRCAVHIMPSCYKMY